MSTEAAAGARSTNLRSTLISGSQAGGVPKRSRMAAGEMRAAATAGR
jgi:hypothetical protein